MSTRLRDDTYVSKKGIYGVESFDAYAAYNAVVPHWNRSFVDVTKQEEHKTIRIFPGYRIVKGLYTVVQARSATR